MKKTLAIFLLLVAQYAQVFALSGDLEQKIETVFDAFIADQDAKTIGVNIKKVTEKIDNFLKNNGSKGVKSDMLRYLSHLLCMKRGLIDGGGILCEDNYHPESEATQQKDTFSLEEKRQVLVTEHNKRRKNRGLGALARSQTLDAIAQKYALKLCKVDRIDHELDGSQLDERYAEGGYNYIVGTENLGYGQTSIAELLDQFTTSIGHRENMYLGEVNEIGVGQCDVIWVLNYGAQ